MTEHKYWSCDRCGRNSKEEKELEIFNVVASPLTAAAANVESSTDDKKRLPTRFDLCINCYKEFLGEWGKKLLK
jgi:hypothetical protein